MLVVVFITQLFFVAIFVANMFLGRTEDSKKIKNLRKELAQMEDRPTYSQGFYDGENEALKNHKKVLDAFRRLYPNAR